MVRTFSALGFFFIVLTFATVRYYSSASFKNACQHRVLTSNSFYAGAGELFKEKYKKLYDCDLNFAVVNGANLIASLYNKQPKQYDVLMGLDKYQIAKLSKNVILADIESEADGSSLDIAKMPEKIQNGLYWNYDEAPLTFFVRDISQTEFVDLNQLILYLQSKNLTLAVPLKTTSVLGALFEDWVKFNTEDPEDILNAPPLKFVKSWSEAFGLFERRIVDGFLSFETSEIYFLNNSDIHKIKVSNGHPNLQEYLAFSAKSRMTSQQQKNFLDFVFSSEIQNLLLTKNYMWPTSLKDHEHADMRNLKIIKLDVQNIQ